MLTPNEITWLRSGDTGISSLTILATLEHDETIAAMTYLDHPEDPADLGRCIRLLDAEPSLRERLGLMCFIGPEWAALVRNWSELEALYHEEAPSGRAPKCYARMRELIDGAL